ncbi:MAG: hypothetical protein AAF799_47710 [Myxococcota bacterium]
MPDTNVVREMVPSQSTTTSSVTVPSTFPCRTAGHMVAGGGFFVLGNTATSWRPPEIESERSTHVVPSAAV